jgi:phosphopantothenoylcysteine decarboxylase / phosphopantothenate---cysteine ligase
MEVLASKHIVLALSGGVACYKSAELCRLLVKAGATVQVVMTEAACQFITPVTMQALSGRKVFTHQWDATEPNNMPHINVTREADVVLIAPASADLMAKLAVGRADELVSLMCLARPRERVPLVVAPAMNREMWSHPATQRNVAQLVQDGTVVLPVGQGEQACGETGDGRMLEPEELLQALAGVLTPPTLHGQHVLVTAGPTFEPLDPVRGLTNRSSGKMGFAIAQAAQLAGAQVTLVAGPVQVSTPFGVQRVNVESAQQMLEAVKAHAHDATVFVACAAVADWRATDVAAQKIKKDASGQPPVLSFTENPDILATIARTPRAQSGALYCVGFAAESEALADNAKAKRERKGVPLLVANLGPQTFGRDDNALLLVDAHGLTELPTASKATLARQLVAEIVRRVPTL